MSESKSEQATAIANDVEKFLADGGEIDTLSDKDKMKAIKIQRKQLLEEERKLQASFSENKEEKTRLRSEVKTQRETFEESRLKLSAALKKLNGIHQTRSAVKHFEDFEPIANDFLKEVSNVESTLDKYLTTLREAIEVIR